MRKSQKFSVRGALNANLAGSASVPVKFCKLKNSLADRRIGALLKRSGSSTVTPTAGLGVPLGIGEHLGAASSSLIPVTRTLLFQFGGVFQKLSSGSYASVAKDANVTVSTAKQSSSKQLGTNLFIACGDPCRWNGSTDIEPVGIPAPSSAPTTSLGGTGITGSYRYMYTYLNSSTGLESDWSPLSSTVAPANQTVTVTTSTATPAADADKKRIYRTQNGGSTYYLVATIDIATPTYADNTADASLGAQAATYLDNGLPPTTAFIVETFAQRVWWVDADNPRKLVWSKPYLGSDNNTQYYPSANAQYFEAPITGLLEIPALNLGAGTVVGSLLVFHPRSVSRVSVSPSGSITFDSYLTGIGTLFHKSLATNGDDIILLAEEGWVNIKNKQKIHLSREIDEELQSLLNSQYSQGLFIGACWNPSIRQFLLMFTAQLAGVAQWEDASSGEEAEWVDSSNLLPSSWEPNPVTGELSTYVKIWGWSPELSEGLENWWQEYEFPQFENLNTSARYPTVLFHPLPSSDTLDAQQDTTYIGYHNGTEGKILLALKRDYVLDDGSPVVSEFITGRCVPGEDNGRFKRVTHIQFEGDYADLTEPSATTLKYLKDFHDPQYRDYPSNLKSFSNNGDMKCLEDGKLKFFHLYGKDETSTPDKILLQDFTLFYREHHHRESR